MARLIPKVRIEEIGVKSERDTARYLTALLPDDCIIYHSYPWLKTQRNDKGDKTVKEGETDFVVILPSHGVLVLEVKGGPIRYDQDNRAWYRELPSGGLRAIQDPFEQVRRNLHTLKDDIVQIGFSGDARLPFTYGYAVIFPDCDYQGPTPPGSEPAIVFSASDLKFLDRRIQKALNQWSRLSKPEPLDTETINKITKAISPQFNLLPVLCRKIEEQEEKLFRLTTEQSNLLNFLGERQRACIKGVAGSGKTMLAQAQAEKFAEQGKRTLFVCFNKCLANWINDAIHDDYKSLITVTNFHALCADYIKKAQGQFTLPKEKLNQFWREDAVNQFVDALDVVPDRFDAVIVDEGQDFYPDWWMALEMVNQQSDDGSLFVFYDPSQNLYLDQDSALPELGQAFSLSTNCRNTKSIAHKCGDIIGQEIATRDYAPKGIEPTILKAEDQRSAQQHIERIVKDWVRKGKLKPSQIAILGPKRKQGSSLADIGSVSGQPIVESIDGWHSNKGVLFSTIKSFKGLEADAVLLIDIPPEPTKYFKDADFYVGCSRAKHMLVIIYAP